MRFDGLSDEDARKWLHALINHATFSGAQASEVLRVRAWLDVATGPPNVSLQDVLNGADSPA